MPPALVLVIRWITNVQWLFNVWVFIAMYQPQTTDQCADQINTNSTKQIVLDMIILFVLTWLLYCMVGVNISLYRVIATYALMQHSLTQCSFSYHQLLVYFVSKVQHISTPIRQVMETYTLKSMSRSLNHSLHHRLRIRCQYHSWNLYQRYLCHTKT